MLTESDVFRTTQEFWSSGGQVQQFPDGRLVRHAAAPGHPLGDFLCQVRASAAGAVSALLEQVRGHAGQLSRVLVDPATPPVVEAELTMREWVLDTQLQLVLPAGEAWARRLGDGAPWDARPVRTDEDWAAVGALFRLDHLEEDGRLGRPSRSPGATAEAVALRRALGDTVEYTLAVRDDQAIGCIAVWVGEQGVGLIEDVFVHPAHRGQRVATGLLELAVRRARARNAGPVVIGAEPGDTPKRLYAGLGFRPTALARSWSPPV